MGLQAIGIADPDLSEPDHLLTTAENVDLKKLIVTPYKSGGTEIRRQQNTNDVAVRRIQSGSIVKSRIRIRTELVWICNTDYTDYSTVSVKSALSGDGTAINFIPAINEYTAKFNP